MHVATLYGGFISVYHWGGREATTLQDRLTLSAGQAVTHLWRLNLLMEVEDSALVNENHARGRARHDLHMPSPKTSASVEGCHTRPTPKHTTMHAHARAEKTRPVDISILDFVRTPHATPDNTPSSPPFDGRGYH